MKEKHRPNVVTIPNHDNYQIKNKYGDNGVAVARDGNGNIFVCYDSTYSVCDICTRVECPIKNEVRVSL